jgi:ATP-dependent helicase/nuclease subunit A
MNAIAAPAKAQAAYANKGEPISAQAFYRIACDPQRSVVVEACAGAGKTWMLVSRMVRALLEGAQPHELLAITFTKKAAGEMRQRLYEWLHAFSTADDATLRAELHMRGLAQEADAAQVDRLRGLHRSLMLAERSVQVRTFHGWFATLVRNAPLGELVRLGLPAQYDLLEDDSRAIAQVWRRFHSRVASDAQARQDYEAAVAVYGRHQTLKALEAALHKRVEFALADAQGVVEQSVAHFHTQFPEMQAVSEPTEYLWTSDAMAVLGAAARVLGAATQVSYAGKGSQLERALAEREPAGVFEALLTQAGGARSFGKTLSADAAVLAAQDLVLRVGQAQAQQLAWAHQQRMLRLARMLLDDYAALKRERGWLDMNDLELSAYRLLHDPQMGAWIQERLDAQVRHLLVDEFQDTNPLQWKTLEAWISGYAGAGRAPSVFIVGDPKQSIYRFRRAEPQVFEEAKSFVREGLQGDSLSCDHTRRNAPAVLDTVNAVFTPLQAQGDFAGFRAHTTDALSAGRVLRLPRIDKEAADAATDALPVWRDSLTQARHVQEETRKVLECRQAAQWLAAEIARGALQASDVMVLARKRERLSLLKAELDGLHIAAQFAEKTELADLPAVRDVLALIDALVSPQHNLSLAQALKSPIFGLDDIALVAWVAHLREQGQSRQFWLHALQDAAFMAQLPASMQAVWQPIAAQLGHWQTVLLQWPPHDALVHIYRAGDVLARYAAATPASQRAAVAAHLQALLGAALSVDGGRFLSAYAFVRALRAGGYALPAQAAPHAVRLLTVHGAKGLEAPLVLMLDCDGESANAETMGVLVQWPGQAPWPRRFVFLASESGPPACCADLVAHEATARLREERNALYVALTRARQSLVFSAMEPHRSHAHSWWKLLADHAQPLQSLEAPYPPTALAVADKASADRSAIEISELPELPPTLRQDLPARAAQLQPDPDLALQSLIGQAMHWLLEHLPLGPHGPDSFSASALSDAAALFALDDASLRRAHQGALAIVSGEGSWVWDAQRLAFHANEVAVYLQGRSLRIDRLVQEKDSGHWWVLDYKTSAAPHLDPDLCAQLERYRSAVRAAYPGQTVQAAFLSATGRLFALPAP